MNNANQNNVLISVLDIENAKKHLDKLLEVYQC